MHDVVDEVGGGEGGKGKDGHVVPDRCPVVKCPLIIGIGYNTENCDCMGRRKKSSFAPPPPTSSLVAIGFFLFILVIK